LFLNKKIADKLVTQFK